MVLQHKATHTADNAAKQTKLYTYTYDHDRRLTRMLYKQGSDAEFVMQENTYDNLGRLKPQTPHGIASNRLTYDYNIRGWLTTISGS